MNICVEEFPNQVVELPSGRWVCSLSNKGTRHAKAPFTLMMTVKQILRRLKMAWVPRSVATQNYAEAVKTSTRARAQSVPHATIFRYDTL